MVTESLAGKVYSCLHPLLQEAATAVAPQNLPSPHLRSRAVSSGCYSCCDFTLGLWPPQPAFKVAWPRPRSPHLLQPTSLSPLPTGVLGASAGRGLGRSLPALRFHEVEAGRPLCSSLHPTALLPQGVGARDVSQKQAILHLERTTVFVAHWLPQGRRLWLEHAIAGFASETHDAGTGPPQPGPSCTFRVSFFSTSPPLSFQ